MDSIGEPTIRQVVGDKNVRLQRNFAYSDLRPADTFTRASTHLWQDVDGTWREAASGDAVHEGRRYVSATETSFYNADGTLITDLPGITTGPAVTNKCQCIGLDPTDTTGVVKGGDAASVLSVVTPSVSGSAGADVYKLDNSGGSGSAWVIIDGTVGNTNTHSIQLNAVATAGTPNIQFSVDNAGTVNITGSTSFDIYASENYTPISTLAKLAITCPAGAVVEFELPGLYELAMAPVVPVASASTTVSTTRAASLGTVPVQVPQDFKITITCTPDYGGNDITSGYLKLFSTDDSRGTANEVRTGVSGAAVYSSSVDAAGGVYFGLATDDITAGVETTYVFSAKQNGANVDLITTKDGVVENSVSVSGTLDHSNNSTLTPGYFNFSYFPGQVGMIKVEEI